MLHENVAGRAWSFRRSSSRANRSSISCHVRSSGDDGCIVSVYGSGVPFRLESPGWKVISAPRELQGIFSRPDTGLLTLYALQVGRRSAKWLVAHKTLPP